MKSALCVALGALPALVLFVLAASAISNIGLPARSQAVERRGGPWEVTPDDSGEVRFYYSGMAQAALLDRLMPDWKARAWPEGVWLEDLLAEAIEKGS